MSLRKNRIGWIAPLRDGTNVFHRRYRSPQFWPIVTLGFILGTTLSGCAAVDKVKAWVSPDAKPQAIAQQPVAPPPPTVAAPKSKRPIHEERELKETEKVASINPDNLIGLDPAGVEKLLGAPSNITKGDPSLVWTYTASGCSVRIVFYPDLKTASFHALKVGGIDGNGNQVDASQSCIRTILTAKANGPG